MGIAVNWDNEAHTAICLSYTRPWTWDDFYSAYGNMNSLLSSETHQVDLLIDIRQAGFPPPGATNHFKHVTQTRHLNVRQVVIVGLPLVVRSFLSILTSVYKGNYETPDFLFFPTLEAAREALAEIR